MFLGRMEVFLGDLCVKKWMNLSKIKCGMGEN